MSGRKVKPAAVYASNIGANAADMAIVGILLEDAIRKRLEISKRMQRIADEED